MKALKGLMGMKGLTSLGILAAIIIAFVLSAAYVAPVFGVMNLTTTADSVASRNVTAGQKMPSLNFTFNISNSGNLTDVLINFSVIGNTAGNFTVPVSNESVTCGGKTASLSGWRSMINGTAVRCYNSTQDGGAKGVFNVTIVNTTIGLYAASVRGLYLFNITTTDNDTERNSTTVGVNVKEITGRASTNVTTAEIGKNQSIQFTITSGSDSQKSIDKIVINFSSAGFIAPTSATCPTIGDPWDAAVIGANDVTCNRGSGGVLGTGASTTITLNGMATSSTGGIKPFYVGLYDTTVGEFANYTNSTSITVFGLLNATGTTMAPGTTLINRNGTNNETQALRLNFSTRGEGMNITEINLTRTGTAQAADINDVLIYNTTTDVTGGAFSIENATLIAKNSSAPRADGTYTFRNIAWNITGDGFLLVSYNVSRAATAGRTVGFSIINAANVTARSAVSGQAITPALVTEASNNATIVGNVTVTVTDTLASQNVTLGSRNLTAAVYTFNVSGEGMNVTQLNLTLTGTIATADIESVALYSTSTTDDDVFNGTETFLTINYSAPRADGTYNFTGVGWNITTSDGKLLVIVNLTSGTSTSGGKTIGFKINPAANVTITSLISGQAITPTLSTTSTTNATIFGNLSINGTSTMPATITLNKNLTDNATQAVRYNFTARGETINITQINVTRTGTATAADILEVALYNTTAAVAGGIYSVENATLLAKNSSAPRADGTYNFSGLGFNVTPGTDNFLIIAFNVSRSATSGRTAGFMINSIANVTAMSTSNISVTKTVTGASNNATIVGNLTITGADDLGSSTVSVGTRNVSVVRFIFAPSGEQMNITQIILTRNNTVADTDILAVGLYNSSVDNQRVFTVNATLIAWNSSAPDSLGRYNFSDITFNVPVTTNTLLVVVNVSSSAAVGNYIGFMLNGTANITVRSAVSNQSITPTLVTTSTANATIVGNLTIVGTDRIGSSVAVGTKNVTAISLNFTAAGEQINVTQINLTRTGSATDADITAVGLYNGTNTTFTGNEEFLTLIAWNSSAPRADGTYNFTGLGFNVSTTPRGNILLVVVNLTNGVTTGRTIGFRINSVANITSTGSVSGLSITETLVTANSSNASIYGNLTITGASQIASVVTVGQRNITVISYNFSAMGEGMNMTGINLTLTGTVSTADIESVSLYNGTNTTFNEDFLTLIAKNTSAPRADGTYNFTGLGFNVTANDRDGNMLVVVVNFTAGSATSGGKTIGFRMNPAGNISIVSAIGNVAITPALATMSSGNATIIGNLTVMTANDLSANVKINQKRVAFINLTLMARGEQVNVSSINLTLRGNASFANVSEIRLFNDDGSATGSLDSTDTVIAGTATAPSSSRVTITPTSVIALTPSTAKVIFVVLNISDESDANSLVGIQINATDIAALTNTTASAVMTNFTAAPTANRTITSNIGQQVVGTTTGWYTLDIPSQTIMESIGRTAGTTQNFNISKILYSLRTNYRFVYYNTDGTSSGWKLYDRTDWAGSSLQYANNTNDKVYWVNMTAEDSFEL